MTDTTDVSFDANYLFAEKMSVKFLTGGIFFDPANTSNGYTIYNFTSIVNTRIPTSIFFLQNLAAETYINQIQSSNISITMINAPFPQTYQNLQVSNSISGFLGTLIFAIAFSFKFSSIISFIVKEKEDRSKHQQIVSGMNIYSYWFGNFIYDYFLYMILAVFSVAMCYVLNVSAYIGSAYLSICILFTVYGLAYIPFTYMFSFVFKDYGNAQAVFYFFTFVVGGLISTVLLVLRMLGGNIQMVGSYITWVIRLLPSYCFGETLINLGTINMLSNLELSPNSNYSPLDFQITLWPIIYMAGSTFLYTILLFLIEAVGNS